MYILGINAFYHDTAAALFKDGKIVAMAEEERFTRKKHAEGAFPHNAIEFCLGYEGITFKEIEYLTFMHDISAILSNEPTIEPFKTSFVEHPDLYRQFKEIFEGHLNYIETYSRERGLQLEIVPHHDCHIASAFFGSDFNEANIISIDGRGDRETAILAHGKGNTVKNILIVPMPHSLGLIYTAVTCLLGFKPFDGEGKVMGLAPYGINRFNDIFSDMIFPTQKGFETKVHYYYSLATHFVNGKSELEKIFGKKRIPSNNSINGLDEDIACSLQTRTEDIVSHLVDMLYSITGCKNLCLAGGVALNAKMNGKLLQKSNVDKIFVQPIANDAGCAIGGPMYLYNKLTGVRPEQMRDVYLGPSFSNDEIKRFFDEKGVNYHCSSNIVDDCAEMLADGKIVGWFQGRMEVGPRALGNRSILANPSDPKMKDKVNNQVKKREPWRPFAPSLLDGVRERYLKDACHAPFMIVNFDVTEHAERELVSAIHIDSTTRPQTVQYDSNPLYYSLIQAFGKRTGIYGLLNTSFNLAGEPIVLTPENALHDFMNSDMDALVLGDFILEKPVKRKIFAGGFTEENKEYNLSFDQYQRYKMVADVVNKLRKDGGLNILDIGSGPCNIGDFLPEDTIVRLDRNYIEAPHFVQGDATSLPFEDDSFDIAISCDCFEHLPYDIREAFLSESKRVAKNIVIACPFADSVVEEAEETFNSFYKFLFGYENKNLVEHKREGLPSLNKLLLWAEDNGFFITVLDNGHITTWVSMMCLNAYIERYGLWDFFLKVNNLFMRDFYQGNNFPTSYRKVVVLSEGAYPYSNIRHYYTRNKTEDADISNSTVKLLESEESEECQLIVEAVKAGDAEEIRKLVEKATTREVFFENFKKEIEEFLKLSGSSFKGNLKAFTEPFKVLPSSVLKVVNDIFEGSPDTAIEVLKHYLEMRPDAGEGWNDLGVILAEKGEIEEAQAALLNACLLDYAIAYENLSALYRTLGDSESAEKVRNEI